eukprot:359097-Chlamydomonas_euryale.AAC.6
MGRPHIQGATVGRQQREQHRSVAPTTFPIATAAFAPQQHRSVAPTTFPIATAAFAPQQHRSVAPTTFPIATA